MCVVGDNNRREVQSHCVGTLLSKGPSRSESQYKKNKRASKIYWNMRNPYLGTGQNLWGTRAGTIDRGRRDFIRKKRAAVSYVEKN